MEIIEIDNKLYRQEEMAVEDIEREIALEQGKIEEAQEKIEEAQAKIDKYKEFIPSGDDVKDTPGY